MNWNEIHADFSSTIEQQFPLAAFAACNADPEAVRGQLLAAVEVFLANPDLAMEENADQTFFFAMYLLLQWREPALLALLLQMARWDQETLEATFGDDFSFVLTQGLAACSQEVAPLVNLAHDRHASMWTRSCAVQALALRVCEGDYAKTDAIHQFRLMAAPWVVDLARMTALAETDDLSDADWVEFEALQWLIQMLAYSAADIGATEMMDECIAWCEAGYMMDENETPATLRECFAGKQGAILAKKYLRDAAAYLQKWHYFQSNADRKAIEDMLRQLNTAHLPAKSSAKIGRNDPCPCGSGKKYKKCCGSSTSH